MGDYGDATNDFEEHGNTNVGNFTSINVQKSIKRYILNSKGGSKRPSSKIYYIKNVFYIYLGEFG